MAIRAVFALVGSHVLKMETHCGLVDAGRWKTRLRFRLRALVRNFLLLFIDSGREPLVRDEVGGDLASDIKSGVEVLLGGEETLETTLRRGLSLGGDCRFVSL